MPKIPFSPATHFNPRPREEGDKANVQNAIGFYHFNPRPREEGDTPIDIDEMGIRYFNPRPREEGDKGKF